MAKQPSPGTTKTRLSPPFSPEEAAACYACFLADTLDMAREAAGLVAGLRPYIAFTPHDAAGFFHNLAPDFALIPQSGHTLGERLDHVISAAFAAGTSPGRRHQQRQSVTARGLRGGGLCHA